MSRPSIFNSNYHKTMRKRKRIFRTLMIFVALIVIFATYNTTGIPNFKKIADNLFMKWGDVIAPKHKDSGEIPKENSSGQGPQEQKSESFEMGEFVFKLSDKENLTLVFEKRETGKKFTEVKSDIESLTYDISNDGQKVVFDNPRTSDVWVYNIDGKYNRVNPMSYKEYKKDAIMKRYNNNYVWAERPKFLKDGRIVYQSYLPWFKNENSYYLWVADSDGKNNRKFFNTNQSTPVKYLGLTEDGNLMVELKGIKYWLNVDDGSKHKMN